MAWFDLRPRSFAIVFPEGASRLNEQEVTFEFNERLFGRIDCTSVEPSVKGAITPEIGQRAVGSNKGFLCNIWHQVHITDHAANEALNPTLVFHDQHLEGPDVTQLDTWAAQAAIGPQINQQDDTQISTHPSLT